MKWLIVTCDASAHIRPVQQWLFRKYAPFSDFHLNLTYIDVGSDPVETWGMNVYDRIKYIRNVHNVKVVFGLDDYLPTSSPFVGRIQRAVEIMDTNRLARFELGYGASNKRPFMKNDEEPFIDHGEWLEYRHITPYSVSCQFSVWNLPSLKDALANSTTPWNFETRRQVRAGCFRRGLEAFRWIEESALSGKKWPGKINVNGLPAEDVEELIKLGLLDESKLINRG